MKLSCLVVDMYVHVIHVVYIYQGCPAHKSSNSLIEHDTIQDNNSLVVRVLDSLNPGVMTSLLYTYLLQIYHYQFSINDELELTLHSPIDSEPGSRGISHASVPHQLRVRKKH